MVNATEMARPFGRLPKHWLETESAKRFLNALREVRKTDLTDLIFIKRGSMPGQNGGGGGTWFHRDVAIEFARWLAPAFAIWCNDRIMELLTRGTEIRVQKGIFWVVVPLCYKP